MKYFKRNGFVALVSMLSLTAYAGDSLPLSVAVSETKEFIQVSGHGIDTSNVIQQERIIQGTVLEEGTNEPLIGVNVVVKGSLYRKGTSKVLPLKRPLLLLNRRSRMKNWAGCLGIVFRIRWTQPFFIQKRMADRIHM